MATPYDDFWNKMSGPGGLFYTPPATSNAPTYAPTSDGSSMIPSLVDFGLGMYSKNAGSQEAADRLGKAQGPLYQTAMGASKGMLDAAGNFDPQAFAKQRFDQQQALLDPVYSKEFDDLNRSLYAKGQGGIVTYNPGVEGITPDGTAMNPQMAAFFAAKNAQRSKDAYGSMQQGQDYLDNLVKRSGMLSGQAGNVQNTGLAAQRTQPSGAAANAELLRGVTGVLKNPAVAQKIPGMISGGTNWIRQMLGYPPSMPDMTQMGGLPDFGSDDYASAPPDLGAPAPAPDFTQFGGGTPDWMKLFGGGGGGDSGGYDLSSWFA